jgi:hypothetical protein
MLALSPATLKRLRAVFPEARDQAVVRTVLERDVGAQLELAPPELERVRCAVLKVSGGSMLALRSAVHLAREDWRDVLVAAGFETDEHAHERWMP